MKTTSERVRARQLQTPLLASRLRVCGALALAVVLALGVGCSTPAGEDNNAQADMTSGADMGVDMSAPEDMTETPGEYEAPIEGRTALVPRFEVDGEGFFHTPWPSDTRLKEGGYVDLAKFPTNTLIRLYKTTLEQIKGFSTMPVVYTELSAYPGQSALPDPARSMREDSPIQLVELGAGCGQRVPVRVDVDQQGDKFIPKNTLRVVPLPGFVLKEKTSYAFVMLKTFGAEAGYAAVRPKALTPALRGEGDMAAAYAPLRACLDGAKLQAEDIAVATVFTVQDVTGETRKMRDVVLDPQKTDAPVIENWELHEAAGDTGLANVYKGTYRAPIFQKGQSPYGRDGGLVIGADGYPEIQRYEEVPFSVLIPVDVQENAPVLVWSDGTGASQFSHVGDDIIDGALRDGFVVFNFVPQFHDTRATTSEEPELLTFNYLNPASGRTVFRQQAAETVFATRVIKEAFPKVADIPTVDTSRLLYGGHSQGAIIGGITAGITDLYAGYALNGIGGYLSTTIIYRKDYTDIEKTIRNTLGVERVLDRYHPAIQLAQMGSDAVDPQNYAPYWKGLKGEFDGSHVFMINGNKDSTTSPDGIAAITVIGDTPVLSPPGWDVEPYRIWSDREVALPAKATRMSVEGKPLTMAAYLVNGSGHFTIYRRAQAKAYFNQFWRTAYAGVPQLGE